MSCYRTHPSFMEKESETWVFTSPTLFSFLKTNKSKISSFLLTNNNKKGSWKLVWVL